MANSAYQREYRERLRRSGYRRVELCLSPKTWQKLEPWLRVYGCRTHPGHALTRFLEDLEIAEN